MKYGYARVSTEDQNPAMELAALKKAGCKMVFKDEVIGHLDREEARRQVHTEKAPSRLPAPVPQETTAHVVLASDCREGGTGLLAFGDDPQLLLDPPTSPPLNSGNDFHPPCTPPLAALLRTPLRSDTGLGRTRRFSPDGYGDLVKLNMINSLWYYLRAKSTGRPQRSTLCLG
jgi:hypothetical protein